MTNVASRYDSDPVLVIDLGNMRPQDLVRQAYTLSRATQERFIHRISKPVGKAVGSYRASVSGSKRLSDDGASGTKARIAQERR